MNKFYKLLEAASIDSPIPGEAPANVPDEPVVTEPAPVSDNSEQNIDIYELYPDLANIDITSPCALADYFATVCENYQADAENQMRSQVVPSLKDMDTPEEFA